MLLREHRSDQSEAQEVDENSPLGETLLLSSLQRIDLGSFGIAGALFQDAHISYRKVYPLGFYATTLGTSFM